MRQSTSSREGTQGPDNYNNQDTNSSGTMPKTEQTEQQFTILPHPAVRERLQHTLVTKDTPQKSNDPRDLEPPQPGAGLTSKPEIAAHHAHGPYIPNEDIVNSLEKPLVSYITYDGFVGDLTVVYSRRRSSESVQRN